MVQLAPEEDGGVACLDDVVVGDVYVDNFLPSIGDKMLIDMAQVRCPWESISFCRT